MIGGSFTRSSRSKNLINTKISSGDKRLLVHITQAAAFLQPLTFLDIPIGFLDSQRATGMPTNALSNIPRQVQRMAYSSLEMGGAIGGTCSGNNLSWREGVMTLVVIPAFPPTAYSAMPQKRVSGGRSIQWLKEWVSSDR